MSKIAMTLALLGSALATTSPAVARVTSASPPKDAPLSHSAIAGKLPPGYNVQSATFTAPNGAQTRGMVHCPGGTVPFGGGVFIRSSSLFANVADSFPNQGTWLADVNNLSGAATTFRVEAVCATRPDGYQVVGTGTPIVEAGNQATTTNTCPLGTVPLGGGLEMGNSLATNINSTFPLTAGWRTDVNNGSGGIAVGVSFVVCGAKPRGYKLITGAPVPNPGNTESRADVSCPGASVPLAGGVRSSAADVFVNLNTSEPQPGGWTVFENNATSTAHTTTPFVICAGI